MSISTFATSFLEHFGLRAFGGWQRTARPGMEDGMFAYDESTAELFEEDTEYEIAEQVEAEPVVACYVPVEVVEHTIDIPSEEAAYDVDVAVVTAHERMKTADSSGLWRRILKQHASYEGVIVAGGAPDMKLGFYSSPGLSVLAECKRQQLSEKPASGGAFMYLNDADLQYLSAMLIFGSQRDLFPRSSTTHTLERLVTALQRLEADERAVILEAIKRGREALSAAQTQRTLHAMMATGALPYMLETKRHK